MLKTTLSFFTQRKKILFYKCLIGIFALKTTASAEQLESPSEYPYWGAYIKTPMTDLKAAPWSSTDGLITTGWDWSLPPEVKAAPHSMIATARTFGDLDSTAQIISDLKPIKFTSNPVIECWVNWKELEAVEGKYTFATLINNIKAAEAKGYGIALRVMTSAKRFAPDWIATKYNIPTIAHDAKNKTINYDVSNPIFHSKYRALVAALGEANIPSMPGVKGLYLGYASHSFGDEGIGPKGENPNTIQHVKERIDAWAAITKGVAYKVYMGGMCQYGFDKGFGVRRGFVEKYLYNIPNPEIGQRVDAKGYLTLDESNSLIANEGTHGEENEEYDEKWATTGTSFRYGTTTDSFPYRYFTANLRLLQMRCTYTVFSPFTLIPDMIPWLAVEMGQTAKTTPDGWCFLRESYLKNKEYPIVKNFERWVFQRDSVGYETTPYKKIDNTPVGLWMVDPAKNYDYIARQGSKIGFTVAPEFISGRKQNVAIKITYIDSGIGSWVLAFNGVNGPETRTVNCNNTNNLNTVTFFVTADFTIISSGYHFECRGIGTFKPTVSFVRIIKNVIASPQE
jgi:hypothetical protein